MYCVNCGVKLAGTEDSCPLCGTEVCFPGGTPGEDEALFPDKQWPEETGGRWAGMLTLTLLYLLPMLIVLLCDGRADGVLSWSSLVVGAMLLAYVWVLLPLWFRRPEPRVFVPCGTAAAGLFVLYVCAYTGGDWFLPFAFPVWGMLALLLCAAVCLWHSLRRGRLWILGGTALALGAFFPFLEWRIARCFLGGSFAGWSLYPAAALAVLGLLLLFLALCRPARAAMQRRLFF